MAEIALVIDVDDDIVSAVCHREEFCLGVFGELRMEW